MKGNSEEATSYMKPPIVEPKTKPTFRKPLKIPIPFPLREAGTKPENMAVIEGLDAARPTPLNIITSSKGQKLPESIIKKAEIAATIMPRINVSFLPVLSAIVPIARALDKKIDWPKKFNDLPPMEQQMCRDTVFYESFSEFWDPGIFIQEAFSSKIFSSNPENHAKIMVQKHLIEGLQRESFKDFLRTTEVRKLKLGKEGIRALLSSLSHLPKLSDEEKADIISQAFRILGFETVNLERLKSVNEYRELHQAPHVDVLAFMIPHEILVAIDEGEMNKKRWYKNYTLSDTLGILKFLGKKEDWKTIIFLAIGRKSSGIDHLEGDVRVISLDYFIAVIQDFFEGKREFATLNAIEKILGYKLKFYWR